MNKNILISEVLKFGWLKTKQNFWMLVAVSLLIILPQIFVDVFVRNNEISKPILSILVSLYGVLVSAGSAYIGLKIVDGKPFVLNDLFSQGKKFLSVLAASLIAGVLILVGLALFIIPGLILMAQFFFIIFLIVDQDLGPINSIKRSVAISKGCRMSIFFYILVSLALNILGVITIVGLFVTVPVTMIGQAYIYRKFIQAPTLEVLAEQI